MTEYLIMVFCNIYRKFFEFLLWYHSFERCACNRLHRARDEYTSRYELLYTRKTNTEQKYYGIKTGQKFIVARIY